jgi:hypothetical protein
MPAPPASGSSAPSTAASTPVKGGPVDETWDKILSTTPAGRQAAGQVARKPVARKPVAGKPVAGKQVGKPARPVIGRVWTTPRLPCDAGSCTLSPAVGTVTFHAKVSGATQVEFFLVPTGTGTADLARSIGVDRNGRNGWSVAYTYADEPLWSHLTVVARGPGGTAEKVPFNIYHPEPLGPTIGRVWTDPALSCHDGWCTLPSGSGALTLHADVRDALGGVTFWLVPVTARGDHMTSPPPAPILIGTAFDRGHGYSVTWSYPDQPMRAYVRITAGNNLGSRSVTPLGLVHR